MNVMLENAQPFDGLPVEDEPTDVSLSLELDAALAAIPVLPPCYKLESCMECAGRSEAHQSPTMRLLSSTHPMLKQGYCSRPNPKPVGMEQFIAAIRQVDCHCSMLTRLPRKN